MSARPERRVRVDIEALAAELIRQLQAQGLVIAANRENVASGKPAGEGDSAWPEGKGFV